MTREFDIAVIGGGVTGLATGALLAKEGRKVAVLEKGNQPGGRAYTFVEKGFTLNYGPHAMYRPHSGMLGDVLRRLGRPPVQTGIPNPLASYWADGERFGALGAKPLELLGTRLFSFGSRLRLLPFLLALRSTKPESLGDMTYGEWVERKTKDPAVRRFAFAFGTVNSYTRPARELSAQFLLRHLQRTMFAKDYVGYLNGGWMSFYDTFIDEMIQGGGELITGAAVDRIEVHDGRAVAVVARGERYEAQAFVSTLPPQDAPALAEPGTALAMELQRWSAIEDVRALCMDLGFDRRVREDLTFIFDIDHDLYFSLHSEVTPVLAPPGGQLLHAMAYLSSQEATDDRLLQERKAELLAGLNRRFPGWRDALVVERVLPNVRVCARRQTPEQQASAALPLRSTAVRNLYFAGDSRDLPYNLTEICLASAMEVADVIAHDVPAAIFRREAVPA